MVFNSCEAQEEKIKLFILSQEDMEIFKIYSDLGFTGSNINRPALINLLNDIKENKIDLVVSYKIDRLTRSPKDFYQLIEFPLFSTDRPIIIGQIIKQTPPP